MRIITCRFRSVAALRFSDNAHRLLVLNGGLGPHLEVHHLHTTEPPAVMDKHPSRRWVVGYSDVDSRVRFVPFPPYGLVHFMYQPGVAYSPVGLSADGTRAVVAESSWRTNVPHLSGFTLRAEKWHPTWTRTGEGYFDGPVCFFDGDRRFVILRREQVLARTRLRLRTQLVVCDSSDGRELAASTPIEGDVRLAVAMGAGLAVMCSFRRKRIERSQLLVYPNGAVGDKPVELQQRSMATTLAAHEQFLLSASGTKVTVWDPVTWKPLHRFDWKIGKVTCLAISPDGTIAAAGGDKGKVAVWDVE